MEPLVSIITICYNAETEVEDTIQSVISQTFDNIEYIVIDGDSTDRTMEKVIRFKQHINQLVSEPDEGIYFAMNKAMTLANGDWITFMNAGDTYADDNAITNLVHAAKCSDEIVFGKSWTCYNGYRKLRFPEFFIDSTNWYLSRMPNHQSILIPRSIYNALKFDTSFKVFADTEFLRKAFHSQKVSESQEIISHFHLGGKSNYYPRWRDFQAILVDTKRLRQGKGSRVHYIKWLFQNILPKKLYLTIYIKYLLK